MLSIDEHRTDDGGEATTQVVLVVPVVIAIVMIALQAALFFHTSNVAGAAAAEGASVAATRAVSSDEASARASRRAIEIIADAGAESVEAPVVIIGAVTSSITVHVKVPALAPFFPRSVRRTATEPRERFLAEVMR